MKSTTYLNSQMKQAGMSMADFMADWKQLSDEDKDWYRAACREECAALGIELEDA